ncbi:MAG: hypothetical protein ABI475_08740 [Methylophilaceae bacterium]
MLWKMKAITLMQMAGADKGEQNKLKHSLELVPLPQGQNCQNDSNLLQDKAVFMFSSFDKNVRNLVTTKRPTF